MTRLNRWIAAVVVVSGIASLSACTQARRDEVPHNAPAGGQTLGEMQTAVSDIPGISVEIAGGGPPNVKGNTGYAIAVTVDPGYRLTDGPALISFLIESAWSVRDAYMPNAEISVSVKAEAGSSFDASAAAAEEGWIEPTDPPPGGAGFTIAAVDIRDGSPARQRLGDWPGDVPFAPSDVTEPN